METCNLLRSNKDARFSSFGVGVFCVVFALTAGLPGCVDAVDEPVEAPGENPLIARGIINASLNRYIETGSDEPFEQFGVMGMFVRYAPSNDGTVDELLGARASEVDLALDTCSMPAPVIDAERASYPKGGELIELLDVGDLSIYFGDKRKPIPTRTFPDLLKVIVGVIYSADETHDVVFRPGQTYDLKATGTDEVSSFEVALEAPADLGEEVKVDGVSPEERTPLVRRGVPVEVTWDADGYGDEVIGVLNWTAMGAPWSMTCRMRDDGSFVIPAVMTAALPDPLTSADEELTLSRIRQTAFRAAGLSSGSFRFTVTLNFPVKF